MKRLFPALAILCLALPAQAQQATPTQGILLELNGAADTQTGACQLTMVVTNRGDVALKRAAWQVAIFDPAGAVQSLPILDFGALIAGKTRVAQFALPGRACDQIGRIVVNDVAECTSDSGADLRDACLGQLATQTRSNIEFGL